MQIALKQRPDFRVGWQAGVSVFEMDGMGFL
jgi:hypothetical protein